MSEKNIISSLNKADKAMLKAIYDYRCLSIKFAYQQYYAPYKISFSDFYNKRIVPFSKRKIIDIKESTTGIKVVFLLDAGINIVRELFNIPSEVYDPDKNKTVKVGMTTAKLMMNPRLINHQLYLNDFAISTIKLAKQNFPDLDPKFYGEKYASNYSIIRPDGIISINDVDLFLEMDMGTETRKQLSDKWNKYRLFTNTLANVSVRKVIVLFIVKCDQEENRKNLIRETAQDVFTNLIDDRFEIFIGNKKELLFALKDKILPICSGSYKYTEDILRKFFKVRHSFSISKGTKLRMSLGGAYYGYYLRRRDESGKIIVSDGTLQEFLFDDYLYSPLSVLCKIYFMDRTSSQFKIAYKRDINYIVLVTDVKKFYSHLKTVKLFDTPKVFYTTINRLGRMPFHRALFQIDESGNLFSCADESYKKMEFEYNIFEDNKKS